MGASQRDDRVLHYTRGLSLFIVPFLVVAFVILYLFPDHTARLWAWTIQATMTSMVLASAYLGGAYFFVRVARERHWHEVATGFLAVTAFSSLLGIATLLHWEKFAHHHVSFWLWAGLYFTAPFLVIGAWLANRRYGAPVTEGDVLLRPVEKGLITAVGTLALVTGVWMFLAPSAVIPLWPWPLTPLTSRVVGATLCLGGAGAGVWFDPRWTSMPADAAGRGADARPDAGGRGAGTRRDDRVARTDLAAAARDARGAGGLGVPLVGLRTPAAPPAQPRLLTSGGTSTASSCRKLSGITSRARSLVEASTTGAATPSW